MNGIQRESQWNRPPAIGHAYVSIPKGVEREAFIETCYRKGRVTISTDYGAVINECYVTVDALQQIKFPAKIGEVGSQVVFMTTDYIPKPIITGVLLGADESSMLKECQYKIQKEKNGCTMSVMFDPDKGAFVINNASDKKVTIQVRAKGTEDSNISIESAGTISIIADTLLDSTAYEEIATHVIDVENIDDIYRTTETKEYYMHHRKNKDGDFTFITGKDIVKLSRETDKNTQEIIINDSGILISTEDGNESVRMEKDKISVKTGKSLIINNGSDSATLFSQVQAVVSKLASNIEGLKNALMLGVGASVPMDGGKAAFGAVSGAASSVVTPTPAEINKMKSEVVTLD